MPVIAAFPNLSRNCERERMRERSSEGRNYLVKLYAGNMWFQVRMWKVWKNAAVMQWVHSHIFIYLFLFTFLYQRYEGTKEKFDSKMMSRFHLSSEHRRENPILEWGWSAMVPTAALWLAQHLKWLEETLRSQVFHLLILKGLWIWNTFSALMYIKFISLAH